MTHHPHVHMIVPGGGISLDGTHWVRCKPGFLLPVRVLSRLFRRLFLARARRRPRGGPAGVLRRDRGPASARGLRRASRAAQEEELVRLRQAALRRARSSARLSRPLHPSRRHLEQPAHWPRRARRDLPLQGLPPQRAGAVPHDDARADEFIRRFLLHVLPKGFHRIRHYGLLASASCKTNIARARELIAAPVPASDPPAAARHGRCRRRGRSSPAMPLLRRPHDHCRDLCARRRTARPALARCRGQDRDAMTPVTASSHHPPAGTSLPAPHRCRPGACKRRMRRRRSGQNHPVDRRRGDKLATAIVDPPPTTPASASPAKAAAPSNPHRRPTAHRLPAGSFLGGFRTPALSTRG